MQAHRPVDATALPLVSPQAATRSVRARVGDCDNELIGLARVESFIEGHFEARGMAKMMSDVLPIQPNPCFKSHTPYLEGNTTLLRRDECSSVPPNTQKIGQRGVRRTHPEWEGDAPVIGIETGIRPELGFP